jgi:hypothetical protein
LETLEDRVVLALVIVPTFDSTITTDPNATAIEATINSAIQDYESYFSNNVTVNITFKENDSISLGQSNWSYYAETYTSYLAALKADETANNPYLAQALTTLPSGPDNPVNGNPDLELHTAEARMLGYNAPAASDGTISLNMSEMNITRSSINPNDFDLLDVVSHEMDEVLGFGSAMDQTTSNGQPAPTGPVETDDLYRYDQTGARTFNTTLSTQAYYSIDGGTTDLARFNQTAGGDFGDWYSYNVPHLPQVQDAFSNPGATSTMGVELIRLEVEGFTPSNASIPVPSSTGVLTINDDDTDDLRVDPDNPAILQLFENQGQVTGSSVFFPTAVYPLSAITQINVNGASGADTLYVDSSGGLINVPNGIHFVGGTGTNTLQLVQPDSTTQQSSDTRAAGLNNGPGTDTIVGAGGIITQTVFYQNVASVVDTVPSGTATVLTIPLVSAADNGGTYSGAAFAATATVTGKSLVAGASLENVTPGLTYYTGTSATGTALSGAPTTAGTYTVLASFAGSTDYTSAIASTTFSISQATPTMSVTDIGGTYDDAAFTETDTVAGVGSQSTASASLEGATPSLTYYAGTNATGTALSGAPTTVGTYTALARFAGSSDYTGGTASATFTIGKTAPTVTATDNGGAYNGAAFAATETVAGVASQSTPAASLEGVTPRLAYYAGTSATGTALSGAPILAGTYAVLASFAGSTDYTSGTASAMFTIRASANPPSSSVTALAPRTSLTSFTVEWSGTSNSGAPIASYDISVSIDGGAFSPWLTGTTQTSSTFTATLGHTYGFISQAHDAASNVEPAHATADTIITTTATPWQNPANPLDVVGKGGQIVPIDALDIINYLNLNPAGTVLPPTFPAGSEYLDIRGTGIVVPADALKIINFLNTVPLTATTTTLTSSSTTSVLGQSVTFTATAVANAPSTAIPTGTVTFYDGTTALGTGTLNSSGVATFTTSALTVGTHSIQAVYDSGAGATANFAGSNSNTVSQVIDSTAPAAALPLVSAEISLPLNSQSSAPAVIRPGRWVPSTQQQGATGLSADGFRMGS